MLDAIEPEIKSQIILHAFTCSIFAYPIKTDMDSNLNWTLTCNTTSMASLLAWASDVRRRGTSHGYARTNWTGARDCL